MGSLMYHWCIKSLYTKFKYTLFFFVRSWRNSVSGYIEPGVLNTAVTPKNRAAD